MHLFIRNLVIRVIDGHNTFLKVNYSLFYCRFWKPICNCNDVNIFVGFYGLLRNVFCAKGLLFQTNLLEMGQLRLRLVNLYYTIQVPIHLSK
jgi:hypothetical protein